jgi:hypothetical protein
VSSERLGLQLQLSGADNYLPPLADVDGNTTELTVNPGGNETRLVTTPGGAQEFIPGRTSLLLATIPHAYLRLRNDIT